MAEQSAPEYTPEVAQAFKENLVRLGHEWADNGNQCDAYDKIMLSIGLPAREAFYTNYEWVPRVPVVVEDTVEEFEAWKANAQSVLWAKADEFGIGETADALFEQAGLQRRSPYVDRRVRIEGTFSTHINVRMRENADVIAAVDRVRVDFADPVYRKLTGRNVRGTEVDWKATVDEPA